VPNHVLLREPHAHSLLSKLRSERPKERLEIGLFHDPSADCTDEATLEAHEQFHHEQNSCMM
jgi:hypothetical protein